MSIKRRDFIAGAAGLVGASVLSVSVLGQGVDSPLGEFGFGWEPDGDLDVAPMDFPVRADLPAQVMLKNLPPVYNQGPIGSCVANAVGAAIQMVRRTNGLDPDFMPSRHFIYYYARELTGTHGFDRGSRISNAVKVVSNRGVCPEDYWPYDNVSGKGANRRFPEGARGSVEPDREANEQAAPYVVTEFAPVVISPNNVRVALAIGYPVIIGFKVFSNIFTDPAHQRDPVNVLNVPTAEDRKNPVGGHAVLLVGYDDVREMFRVRNSWGSGSHDKGYFDMSYDYVFDADLCSDFWTITDVMSLAAPG